MNASSLNLKSTLAEIRIKAVALADGEWKELGEIVNSTLPDPLNPMALLPVATGRAVDANIEDLVNVAANVVLADMALRIVDDYADNDNAAALSALVGSGRAMNVAMALNTIAAKAFLATKIPSGILLNDLMLNYFNSFIAVCHGQDMDITKRYNNLDQYKEVVNLKTVTAYKFAAAIGVYIGTSDETKINLCYKCGYHLGLMTQILDDIESLWFPAAEDSSHLEIFTFPVFHGLASNHPSVKLLNELCNAPLPDRIKICELLDEMDVRSQLLSLALDHRDEALESLNHGFNPEGFAILNTWLDWLLRNGSKLLVTTPPASEYSAVGN